MNPILEELKERGLLRETFGNAEATFKKGEAVYVGTDPTADSLGVHHLIAFTTAKLLQSYGMKPIVLVGTATASLGDPSFKDKERDIVSMDIIMHNTECIKRQISKILDFNPEHENHAIMVNNYDWFGKISFLDFMRDYGKKMTVNYMLAKDSVKTRLEREGVGLSFCEFSYSILQGADFVHLYEKYACKNQIGGVDQTGNIASGFRLAHMRNGFDGLSALVWDLITDSTGKKFGKSEGNAVWLDPSKTSPFSFYQFWLNQSDADAEKFIKMFTLIPLDEINVMIEKHRESPEKRYLQKELAKYMTVLVHSEEDYKKAIAASEILYGKATTEQLQSLDEATLLDVFKGVPTVEVDVNGGINVSDVAIECKDLFTSKGDFKKLVKGGGVSLNKVKVTDPNFTVTKDNLLNGKYLLMQKGKKYSLVISKG